jgi:transposase InsO family protein
MTLVCVGIDVSKPHLDVHIRPLARAFRVTNDAAGCRELVGVLKTLQATDLRICCEASLKRERDFPASCTRDDARAIVFEYVALFYNPVRRHSSLGYLSPGEYERRHNPTLR